MNTASLFTSLRSLALAGTTALALVGCMTQEEGADNTRYDSDGQGAFLVTEMDQMGQSLGQFPAEGLAKAAGPRDFEIKGELVIVPWSYQADCQCFVRKANFTGHKGYERERLDSVTFLDSAGTPMDKYRPAKVAKVLYRRDVHHSKGAREADVRIDIAVDIKVVDGARVGVWNGTMSGAFNGQEFKSATISDVVRPFVDGRFRFPESGVIELTRPVYHFKVTFLGDGKAKVVITHRLNKRIHVLWVNQEYQETAPAAE